MALLAGDDLDRDKFFKAGHPVIKGSTFDLTIGSIFDAKGDRKVEPYNLKPGEMVQVVSAEEFNLPNNVTGHVTYKTRLTRKGIWALTVGIIDPGWNGPMTTTLFNFSKVEFPVAIGTPFLRVSLFQHKGVHDSLLKTSGLASEYKREVQSDASTVFPRSFLNLDVVASSASKLALKSFNRTAIALIAASAIVFALIQLVITLSPPFVSGWSSDTQLEIEKLNYQIEMLRQEFDSSTQVEMAKLRHQMELQGQDLDTFTQVEVEKVRQEIELLRQDFDNFKNKNLPSDLSTESNEN
ncbi:dCTP deaminase domain-containing protein [Ruegeria arenilitoris]|uniref:dCTP deaminase domain-containing protein n=1 Tax=Ruegeria arenilitoris TaxID=1173585 RepID=UPI003C7DF73E